jgi:hypothetical protein
MMHANRYQRRVSIPIIVIKQQQQQQQQHQQQNNMIHLERAHGHRIVGFEMKNCPEGDNITLGKARACHFRLYLQMATTASRQGRIMPIRANAFERRALWSNQAQTSQVQ